MTFKARRGTWMFWGGFVLGLLVLPVCAILGLRLFGGPNLERQSAPAPLTQPDISVAVSRKYLEQTIDGNPAFTHPVVELGAHPQGGAVLTLTVGYSFPIVGVQDVQTRSQITVSSGAIVVKTERAGLGEHGGLRLPGGLIERALSTIITTEINKRLDAQPLTLDIINVRATSEALLVDAALRQPGE